ncbi:hypothetical protein BKCO1_2500021 [Neofusicoccum parvum]|uniref:Uncharacterized protein n=1 Tax=Neofusicoccum parvum TaxID=310453 RepID=A0ACB5SCW3_9PEZI|nr:hypothetical protein BKCO1_2500021 [Neofusicoccum parvum]GME38624.1 hypothetical protein BKCO1_2500021 [Neofusicoccum parvum]
MRELVRERVLVEWQDEPGGTSVLGSVTAVNKEQTELLLCVDLDASGRAFIRLSLAVAIHAHGRSRPRTVLLVLPPDALEAPSFTFETLRISQVDAASAIHEAGLSPDGYILRASFELGALGYAVLPNTTVTSIKPATLTASGMLRAMRLLSETRRFVAYIQPSDYARVGLAQMAEHVRGRRLKPPAWEDQFGNQAQRVDWDSLCSGPAASRRKKRRRSFDKSSPPPYDDRSRPALQVGDAPLPSSPRCLGPPAPAYIPPTPSPPTRSASPEVQVRRTCTPAMAPSAVSIVPEIPLPSQQHPPPQPPPAFPTPIHALLADAPAEQVRAHLTRILTTFLTKAFSCNAALYSNNSVRGPLRAMVWHARNGDVTSFCAARVRCAARFFYDLAEQEQRRRRPMAAAPYVADMEGLLAWMLGTDGDAFADVLCWGELLELGRAACGAVEAGAELGGRESQALVRYNRCKSACVARLLAFVVVGEEEEGGDAGV